MKKKLIFGWLFRIFAMMFLITPLLILAITRKDEWFIHGANKVSIGFIIALLFAFMLLKGAFKNLDQRFTTIITLLTFSVIVWLLDTIIDDMFWILICATIGYVVYLIVDSLGISLLNKYKVYSQEHIRQQAREEYAVLKVNGRG